MGENSYREAIYDVFADTTRAVDEKVDRALDLGTEYLGLSIGFLTRVDDGTQEIVRATGDHELLQPGETCPLDEAYCRRTLETDSPLAVGDAAASTARRSRRSKWGFWTPTSRSSPPRVARPSCSAEPSSPLGRPQLLTPTPPTHRY